MISTVPALSESDSVLQPGNAFEARLVAALNEVLDPELDTSVVELGFAHGLVADEATGEVEVRLKLPTFWCSANFAYLMMWEAREQLLSVPGVSRVRVLLDEHFADAELNRGINDGASFKDIFPAEATENLGALRETFTKKAYMRRHEILLELLGYQLRPEAIVELPLAAIEEDAQGVWLKQGAERVKLSGAVGLWSHYLERRKKLGYPGAPGDLLCLDADGLPLSTAAIRSYLSRCRSTRINMDFNRALCEGLLESRREMEATRL